MTNDEVAEVLRRFADLLELQKENPYRIRAYRRAARTITETQESLEDIAREKGLEKLAGIGRELARKIEEVLATGTLTLFQELQGEVPEGLSILLQVPDLPPQTARFLYHRLRIERLEDLEELARSHLLRTLPGFSEERERKILEGVSRIKDRNPQKD
jgi:DNA polymerase (family 10)